MAKKLRGMLNLSKIDKNLIVKNKNGDSVLWVDILEIRNAPDQYGNTHTITTYNAETKETRYLGNFKPQEFGAPRSQSPAPAASVAPAPAQEPTPAQGEEDLPF